MYTRYFFSRIFFIPRCKFNIYQNKSGQLLENKTKVRISSHRTSKYKTLEDKINFISKKHCDKYVLLSRDEKEWEVGKKIYYLMIFDSSLSFCTTIV